MRNASACLGDPPGSGACTGAWPERGEGWEKEKRRWLCQKELQKWGYKGPGAQSQGLPVQTLFPFTFSLGFPMEPKEGSLLDMGSIRKGCMYLLGNFWLCFEGERFRAREWLKNTVLIPFPLVRLSKEVVLSVKQQVSLDQKCRFCGWWSLGNLV